MSQSNAVLKENTNATRKLLHNRAEAVAAAAALAPRLRERAVHTEEIRRVPDETIAELHASGLFSVLTPKRFGGSELGLATLIEATVELAQGCVSSGWVYGNLVGHYWLLSQFPLAAQEAVHQKPTALVSTIFRFGGEAPVRVEGGYRIKGGQGKWASGIDHADWVILGVTPVGEAPCFMLVNRKDFDIVDDWHTSGMRGTGSKSVHVTDAVIADDHVIRLADAIGATSPGGQALGLPLFRLSMNVTLPFSLVGAPLGAALGAVRVFSESNGNRLKTVSEEEQSEQSATFARVGEAAAMVDSVFALVMRDAERIDALNSIADLTPRQRMQVARDLAFAGQTARRAVNHLIEASGGSTIYNTSEIQRIWRDINGVCGHAAFTWDAAMASAGRFEFGLPPSKFDRRSK